GLLPMYRGARRLSETAGWPRCLNGRGKTLRVFEEERPEEVLRLFAEDYRRGRIYAGRKRIVVSEYPAEAAFALSESGFIHEMKDYVLYR
ncbi:MAG: hypothetical protein K2P23_01145, partial [Lachnospiraceae bacterium]|nr:hypothetical protein [Lachnospiraceae bacterium]